MSASLVGSEMCIRDRVGPFALTSFALAIWVVALLPGALPTRLPWSSLGPVSYTHLTLPTICSV
eukprot:8802023-Alexandrium_andersonii.AAC.1